MLALHKDQDENIYKPLNMRASLVVSFCCIKRQIKTSLEGRMTLALNTTDLRNFGWRFGF